MVGFRSLAYFVTTCRSGSFAHAAADLQIAVSTLSMTLKALGQELDLTLFRRSNNTLNPTAASRALMRAAEPLLIAEMFARRHFTVPPEKPLKHCVVDINLSFTIGGISKAMRLAIDRMAAERADVFVEPRWRNEKDLPHLAPLTDDWKGLDQSQITIALGEIGPRRARQGVVLLSDPWVFALRLPAGTRRPPNVTELMAGCIVIPALTPPLVEQADRYFSQHKVAGLRFVSDHPGDLSRTLDDYPDAALFVPRSLVSARLGLANLALVEPEHPLTMDVVAYAPKPDAITRLFVRHLKRALAGHQAARAERPVISLRQIQYFNLIYRVRRISAAARGANVSQPALSEQLHKLEASLGGALFERNDDGVVPTAKGDRFARFAGLIETGFRRLSTSDVGATLLQGRRTVVGILPSVNQHGFLVNRIADAIIEVQARYPALKLVLQEAPNGTLQDWLIRGLVGVAIVETTLPHMPRLPLGSSEGLAAIAHPAHRLLPPGPVRFADLTQCKLALPTNRFGLRQLLENAASERGLRIRPAMEIDALPMAVALLARLPVCTVLPASAVAQEIERGDLVAHPITDPTVARRLYVIYSGERTLSDAERSLVNILRRKLSEHLDAG